MIGGGPAPVIASETDDEPLLRVDKLVVEVPTRSGSPARVLDGACLEVESGEAVGIVGESGSGKTMLCRALTGVLGRQGGRVCRGSIRYVGQEMVGAGDTAWNTVRANLVAFVPQSSLVGLNPVLSVESHLREILHDGPGDALVQARVSELLEMVRLPRRVLRLRAHELSGGMRQRVMIALALATNPRLLIADEPTTALDVTIQGEVLATIARLRDQLDLALVLVSHDLAVIEEVCSRIVVMYAGATMEVGQTSRTVDSPLHPYTAALQLSRIDRAAPGRVVRAIEGSAPSVGDWPTGCRFRTRCAYAIPECGVGPQPTLTRLDDRYTACIRATELQGALL